jgi:AcrR family transcriptional regulator
MDDISNDMGISKKTLYQLIATKEQLVDEAITDFITKEESVISHLKETSTDALHEMTQVAQHIVEIFGQIRPILINDLQKYYKKTWNKVRQMQNAFVKDQIRENIKRGIKEGVYRKDIDPDIISSLYVEKSWALTNNTVFSPSEYDRDKLVKQHMLYHIHGILSELGRTQFKTIKIF